MASGIRGALPRGIPSSRRHCEERSDEAIQLSRVGWAKRAQLPKFYN